MLSIRSGGIWPRRTPACGGLRGTTAFAYGGSQCATAPARRGFRAKNGRAARSRARSGRSERSERTKVARQRLQCPNLAQKRAARPECPWIV